jgi:hypothetical protein
MQLDGDVRPGAQGEQLLDAAAAPGYSVAGIRRLSCLLCLRLLRALLYPALQLLSGHHVLLAAKALPLSCSTCSSLFRTCRRWSCLLGPLQRRLQRLQHGRHTPFSRTLEHGLNQFVHRLKKHRSHDLPQSLRYRRKRLHRRPQGNRQGFLQRLYNRPEP